MKQIIPGPAGGDPILVIGGVTIDTVHLPGAAHPRISPGGAGLYTALGAQAAGGRVTLFAQRPDPLPEILTPFDHRLDWIGPVIPLADLPRLEIVHYGGGNAELRKADWGAQRNISPNDLPAGYVDGAICQISPLGPTEKQIRFAASCRGRGARAISAGTYGRAAYGESDSVRELLVEADYFFMNENEAAGLFGSADDVRARPGQVVFVTLASEGALAITEAQRIHVPAPKLEEINPTGAGDTFCGAALAVLASGGSIEEALRTGVLLAAERVRGRAA